MIAPTSSCRSRPPTPMIWDVPTSMRNVDAECELEITLAYAQDDSTPGEGLE